MTAHHPAVPAGTDAEADIAHLRGLQGRVAWPADGTEIGTFIAESDLGTAPVVVQALHDAVDKQMFGYLAPALAEACAAATADFLTRRHGVPVDPEQVRLLPDVLSAMHELVRRLPAGARIVLPTPAYPNFFGVPARHGTELVEVPLARDEDRLVHDLDALAAALRPGDLFVLCNPHNPSGRVYTRDELAAVAEVVDAAGATVLADEIHAELLRPGHRHVPYASLGGAAAAHSTTATSASKSFNLPGLRCAQLVASTPQAAREWDARAGHLGREVSTPGVIAVTAAYTDGDVWLDGLLRTIDARHGTLRGLLAEHLPRAVLSPAEGTALAWVDVRGYDLGDAPGAVLRAHGVHAGDGPDFGRAGNGHVRLNLATTEPILRETVRRIAAACAA